MRTFFTIWILLCLQHSTLEEAINDYLLISSPSDTADHLIDGEEGGGTGEDEDDDEEEGSHLRVQP